MTRPATRVQRSYDHRLRKFVHDTCDVSHATRIGVPRSTASGWVKRDSRPVISLKPLDEYVEGLECEVVRLRNQTAKLRHLIRLLFLINKMCGFSFQYFRVPSSAEKTRLLKQINKATIAIPLGRLLNVIGLSRSRFHSWNDAEACELADKASCPKSYPSQLTVAEVDNIRSMVTSTDYRHLSTGAISRVARKVGKLFASPATWYRLVRLHKWRRPRFRVHPAKPKVGIRATKPNEIWHVDTSLLRLLDGSRVYMHAVIDNFSRRILAWTVGDSFDTGVTAKLLSQAAKGLTDTRPNAVMDSGIENINASVNELIESGIIQRVLAQVDVTYSNSMIESWWRAIKHQWLFLHSLDTVETVRRLVTFYVEQHNTHVPHYAFKGQTPDEMFFGIGTDIPEQLHVATVNARKLRRESNLAESCANCKITSDLVVLESLPPNTT